jgi:hypothetical protein
MTLKRFFAPFCFAAVLASWGCTDDGFSPNGTLRFGQIGEIRLHLSSPLPTGQPVLIGQGELQQSLTWSSSGPWQLTETISYQGRVGDENTFRSVSELPASEYAIWITQVNDRPELSLFDPVLVDPTLQPECGATRTKLTLTIRDLPLDQNRQWVRCVEGTLGSLAIAGAGDDLGAARVAQAAFLMREAVFPPPTGFRSSFHGSVPFGTAARGEDTPALISSPFVIRSFEAWTQFWTAHNGTVAGLPPVDFNVEMVLVATIGQRFEAGETVEVRRVLAIGEGTLVEVVHRIPGNFCSPVSRTHRPFHVVIVPALPLPITFADIRREEVPCG